MATAKKRGGQAGFEFDCESEPIAPGTKCGPRMPIEGKPQPISMRVWWIVGAVVVAALIVGIFIGRSL